MARIVSMAVLACLGAAPAAAQAPASATAFGAICDGGPHALGSVFATLDAARRRYPDAVALTDELDAVAINRALEVARRVVLPATPGGKFCRANIPIVVGTGTTLAGQGRGATVIQWELAPGAKNPDYETGVVLGMPSPTPHDAPITDAHVMALTIDGGWAPDGVRLGSPSPVGARIGTGVVIGALTTHSDVTDVEVRHEYGGAAILVSGSDDTVQRSFVHDNWGNGIYLHGGSVGRGADRRRFYASNDRILDNTLSHNSLQNYPARNASGGYGGAPGLMTGTGPVFVFFPAGRNENCPGAHRCLGGNDGIDFDPNVHGGLARGNTLYGNDMLALDLGEKQDGGGLTPGDSFGIAFIGNRVVASATGGASVSGFEHAITIRGNRFERMIDSLRADMPSPPTLAEQLAAESDHGCSIINGAASDIVFADNTCEGGSVSLDYRTFPPTEAGGVRTFTAGFGVFMYATIAPGGQVLAPSDIRITGNTFRDLGRPDNRRRYAVVGFGGRFGAARGVEVTGNTFLEDRGLPRPPFSYVIDLGAAENSVVSGNRAVPAALGAVRGGASAP